MLQIDLKPSKLSKRKLLQDMAKEQRNSSVSIQPSTSRPSGLNSYNSLNRAVRIKNMARIVEDNKLILRKLQGASSFYSIDRWETDNKRRHNLV